MLRRALLLRRFIDTEKGMLHSVLSRKQKALFLNDDEWQLAEEIEVTLSPFYVVTINRISGNAYTSSASVAHLLKRMIQTLESVKCDNDFHCSDSMVDKLTTSLKFYWRKHLASEIWLTASICTEPVPKKTSVSI